MIRVITFFGLFSVSSAVIYRLNESDYDRMPPLYHLEDYTRCMVDPAAVYCLVDVELYSETPSPLLHMIQEFSADTLKHFNHTQIHRGVCVTRSCKQYITLNNSTEIVDLNKTLEECLNASLYEEFKLQGKLANVQYCLNKDKPDKKDGSDVVMAVVYLIIIMFNAIGTLYDIILTKRENKSGNPYLLSFSIKRNWSRLIAPATRGQDPRLDRLKLFNGLRTMTMFCVFFSHTTLIQAYSYVENPSYIEEAYDDPLKQLLFNGSLVTHTFFVMSSFLLAYNLQMYAENHSITFWQWPKGILMRWLRLTPVYALILATVCTWMRHFGSGPLWPLIVNSESNACRQYWWAHVLYVNNYVYDDVYCFPTAWYLASDTQLFCVGLLLCIVARTPRSQKIALAILFSLALLTPALHTYLQDLDAVVMQSPETYRNLYQNDSTFRLLYIRGHTNLSTYTLGLAGGFLVYYWQKQNKDLSDYKKYRFLLWLVFPVGVAIILSGGLFYRDGPRVALFYRVLYATVYKPAFQFVVVAFIVGCIFKFENVYRSIVEWRGFTWTGRVSYSAYLVHTLYQRGYYGSLTTPPYMSDYNILMILSSTIFLSFTTAAVLWLLVESPLTQLTKAIMTPKQSHIKSNITTAEVDNSSKL